MSDHHAPAAAEKPSLLSNVLAIIGLIILVIIIVWGVVHLAELGSGWFTSLFKKSEPTLQITAPADAISGTPATISWNYATSASGSYAFLYQCQDGLQFATIDAATHTATGIPCGTADAITPSGDSVQLLPILSATTSASVPYSIIFTPTGGTAVVGSATMTVHPASLASGSAQVTASQSSSQTATTAAKPATTVTPARSYATPADLAVRIMAQSVDQYGNGVVTFTISNVGGTTSGAYYFSAQMPTSNPTPYSSSLQAPLTPGSYIVDTLRFSPAVSGTFSVAINAGDRNQSNNYASQWISAPAAYYQNNVYSPYTQYQTYPYTY